MRGSTFFSASVDALAGPGSALHTLSQGAAKPGSGPLDHWAAVKRLAEFDVRPHEPYDVAISGIFIVVMLVVRSFTRTCSDGQPVAD